MHAAETPYRHNIT